MQAVLSTQIRVLIVSCDLDIGVGSGFHKDIMFTFARITDLTYYH